MKHTARYFAKRLLERATTTESLPSNYVASEVRQLLTRLAESGVACNRCHKLIAPDEHESCFWCIEDLCYECWDMYGHCGHAEADAEDGMTWISVDDRLPECDQVQPDGTRHSIDVAICFGDTWDKARLYPAYGEWHGENWVMERGSVTHWQPLPDPPEVTP